MIDPNVWISGLINPYGRPALVVRAVAGGELTAVVTQHLLDELAEVRARPKFRRWIAPANAAAFVDALAAEADFHSAPINLLNRVRDPDDDYLAALSEVTGAPIVTGDRDLLEAELMPPAITPAELLRRLG